MRLLSLLLAGGCGFSASLTGDASPGAEPIAPDAAPDAFDARCFGGGTFYFCLDALPAGEEPLDNDDPIDTSACTGSKRSIEMIGNTSVCVIAADTITLGQGVTVAVNGARPLVLVGVTSITITGSIDASSYDTTVGPAGNAMDCATGVDGASDAAGGGGGAGGTFGTLGGAGGAGAAGATMAGKPPTAASPPSPVLRGGCRGGAGAAGVSPVPGGSGGGALFLVSRGTITIDGILDVSGGGGEGGNAPRGGGSGGGSGGMIVFHADTLNVNGSARIYANGGGGGGGAGTNDSGDDGDDPLPPNITSPALGGQSVTAGRSQGGNGAAGTTGATAGMQGNNGGGGGGGGAGQIRVLRGGTSFPNGTVSPPPIL